MINHCFAKDESLEEWGQENGVGHGPSFLIPQTSLLPKAFNSLPGICSALAEQNALSADTPKLPLAFKPEISEAPAHGPLGVGRKERWPCSLPLPGDPHGGQAQLRHHGDTVAQERKASVGSGGFC